MAVGPAGLGLNDQAVLFFVAIVASISALFYFAMVFIRGGKRGSAPARNIFLSEEERAKRRRKALQRFNEKEKEGIENTCTSDQSTPTPALAHGSGKLCQQLQSAQQPHNATSLKASDADAAVRPVIPSESDEHQSSNVDKAPTTDAVDVDSFRKAASKTSPGMGGGKNLGTSTRDSDRDGINMKATEAGEKRHSKELKDVSLAKDKEKTVNKRSRLTPPPPVQLLCEALSQVCGIRVTVEQGGGSWGGQGWTQKKRAEPFRNRGLPQSAHRTVLPLVQQPQFEKAGLFHRSSSELQSRDEEWSLLRSALMSITSLVDTNPFSSIIPSSYVKGRGLVALAAMWHAKACGPASLDVINRALQHLGACSEDKKGLEHCLLVIANYASEVLALWLDKDLENPSLREEEEEESDEEDLFSDFYNESRNKARDAQYFSAPSTALEEFIQLCGRTNNNLTLHKTLLREILAKSSDRHRLSLKILRQVLVHFPNPNGGTANQGFCHDAILKNFAALSYLMGNSADVAVSLRNILREEVESLSSTKDGNAMELSSALRYLLSLGGYTVPFVGFERENGGGLRGSRAGFPPLMKGHSFYNALKSTETFPLGAYGSRNMDPSITKVLEEAHSIMRHARSHTSRVLSHCMRKKGVHGKDAVFRWFGHLAHANEGQANLLQEQLLDGSSDIHSSLSSRPFLLGGAFSVLEACCRDLTELYEKKGVEAFDPRYLISESGSPIVSPAERRLVPTDDATVSSRVSGKFSGATEFFFITSAMLRVSLFPGIRTRNEYARRYKSTIAHLVQLAKSPDKDDKNLQLPEGYRRCSAGFFGWDTCLDGHELMDLMVEFSILQLRFLADLSDRGGSHGAMLSLIPESMAKLPSQYIAHVASHFQRRLSPSQAESAVRHATLLLGSGVELSVQVRTELMRISMAFVRAGVQRAHMKQRNKLMAGRRRGPDDDEDIVIDRRGLEIYASLDRNDHGVVVFCSAVATKRLGPALVDTFVAMEAVEGLDVERENMFHKNMVQDEVVDLLLRLWVHPSGDFRRSIVALDSNVLNKFLRSVASSASIESDTVHHTILDIRDVLEHHVGGQMSNQTQAKLNSSYERLPSFLGSLRRLFLLLSYLSQDERISAILGGGTDDDYACSDISIMLVSILDKFTSRCGGTHKQIDFRAPLGKVVTMSSHAPHASKEVNELLYARKFTEIEFGLDISVIAHLFIALAARWALAASKQRGRHGTPTLIRAIISHDDFDDIGHFRNVYDRLIVAAQKASVACDQEMVERADGHIDSSSWTSYESPGGIGLEGSKKQRRDISAQDQLTHTMAKSISEEGQIQWFLNYLEKENDAKKDKDICKMPVEKSDEEYANLEQQLLQCQDLDDEGYNQHLKDWVVSSDSFLCEDASLISHFYNTHAKTRCNPVLGKILLKDARRCWKDLPEPHPNASIFVCYAEDRMDICKSAIIGGAGTPYSMGIFLFDICYPQLYPSAAPMVHFMTTGGGQVRFSPNLYNDGKVCISLLGTTNAWHESQRWNPDKSSLAQVLLSIQTQILDIAEPYFAEGGGHGGLEGSRAGVQGSARYNNTLRLSTLRHAMIEPLKSPPKGFEDVTRRHFAMCRKRLMVQAKVWVLESRGTELYGRFVKAYSELLVLLTSKTLACESWELADAGGATFGALAPLSRDLGTLQHLDKNIYATFMLMLHRNKASQANEDDQGGDDEFVDSAMLQHALELSLRGSV